MSTSPSDADLSAAAVPPPSAGHAVPPPPPAAVTMPPARPVTAAAAPPESGIGSAKGVRWRGEVDQLEAGEAAEADDEVPPRSLAAVWHDTLREAPSWLISLVIHLVLMLLLALIASPVGQQLGRVVLTMGTSERQDAPELSEFTIDDISEVDADAFEETAVDVPMPVPTEVPLLEQSFTPQPPVVDVGLENQAIAVPPMVSGRTGAMKSALLAAYGGTEQTEDAVKLGLQWLKRQQQRDGSWRLSGPYLDGSSMENRPAATAMALLAFLGAGNTHRSGEYAAEVEKAIKWLINQQDRAGFFAKGARGDSAAYAQAQCTIAICELYAMTGDSWLREPAQRAVDYAQQAQSSEGGWRYQPRQGSDLSVTGWFVMALESARAGGLNVDSGTMSKVGYYLDSVQSYDGAAYSYQRLTPPTPSMTAEGLLCRQYLGWKRDAEPLDIAVATIVTEYNFKYEERNFYYWYYATQVLHHYGGSAWHEWNEKMRTELPAAQVKTGREAGSWSPQGSRWGHSGGGGRLYTTCMAIYCLEVYYRHMPLYSGDQERANPLPASPDAPGAFRPRAAEEG